MKGSDSPESSTAQKLTLRRLGSSVNLAPLPEAAREGDGVEEYASMTGGGGTTTCCRPVSRASTQEPVICIAYEVAVAARVRIEVGVIRGSWREYEGGSE